MYMGQPKENEPSDCDSDSASQAGPYEAAAGGGRRDQGRNGTSLFHAGGRIPLHRLHTLNVLLAEGRKSAEA
jgi:hypothetical protein